MTDYRPKRHLKWFKYRKSLYGTASQKRLVYPSYVFILSLFGITAVTKIFIYLVLLLNPIFTYDYVTYMIPKMYQIIMFWHNFLTLLYIYSVTCDLFCTHILLNE